MLNVRLQKQIHADCGHIYNSIRLGLWEPHINGNIVFVAYSLDGFYPRWLTETLSVRNGIIGNRVVDDGGTGTGQIYKGWAHTNK